MNFAASLEQALSTPSPALGIRSLVQNLASQGVSNDQLLRMLDEVRQQMRTAGRTKDEEAVMDVMDFVAGWCSPHMAITPSNQPIAGA